MLVKFTRRVIIGEDTYDVDSGEKDIANDMAEQLIRLNLARLVGPGAQPGGLQADETGAIFFTNTAGARVYLPRVSCFGC